MLNGYLITFGSFLLLAGRLGDLIGRRRIFLIGVTGFTVASAACGVADSQGVLIVARFIQGLAGAGAVSAIVAIITAEFPSPRERAKAMSVYTLVISGGASLGLIAGGVITEALNWHSHAAGPRGRPGPRAAQRVPARLPDRGGVRGGRARGGGGVRAVAAAGP